MKKLLATVFVFVTFASTHARAEDPRRLEVAAYAGAFLGTGDQRDLLDDAVLTGLIASYDIHPNVALVGSFAWAPSQAKGLALDNDVDLYQYDVGVQGQLAYELSSEVTLKPFAGLGVGARTYSLRNRDVDAETDFAGYAALGASAEYRGFALRLTARDYLTSFDGLAGGGLSEARNNLGLFASAGMRF